MKCVMSHPFTELCVDSLCPALISEPNVTLDISSQSPTLGSPLTFTCTYSSTEPVTNIQWFINGDPVMQTSAVADVSSTLVVETLAVEEEGYYQCFVRTENGDSTGATVLVSAEGQ